MPTMLAMRGVLCVMVLVFTGCAQQLPAQRPAATATAARATPARPPGPAAATSRQRSTVCSYTIPGQPEFGMTCKER